VMLVARHSPNPNPFRTSYWPVGQTVNANGSGDKVCTP
jgi:hypothetical protein